MCHGSFQARGSSSVVDWSLGRLPTGRCCVHVAPSVLLACITSVCQRAALSDHVGHEDVRDPPLVLLEGVAVLLLQARVVAREAVQDHGRKKDRVEVRQDVAKATCEAPDERHDDVARVVHLPCICVPAADEKLRACIAGRNDDHGILQRAPRKLWERPLSGGVRAAELGFEAVLLAVAGVPHVVRDQEHRGQDCGVGMAVLLLAQLSQDIVWLVRVHQRDASGVPEDEHPTPFLVEDIPCSGDALLTLDAGVGVQEVRAEQDRHWPRDVPMHFRLLDGG
mmetsp:Transcript_10566/g.43690  ORF Transcript_10566/g.43690 Transcript_10566/m.43690 type:complete len:280 (-) Transcript_10566:980-1819(-)